MYVCNMLKRANLYGIIANIDDDRIHQFCTEYALSVIISVGIISGLTNKDPHRKTKLKVLSLDKPE